MSRMGDSSSSATTSSRVPKLTHHKASGRAVVRLSGKDLYCGDWGTKAAKTEYDRVVGLWILNGRHLPGTDGADLRIAELVKRYQSFAAIYYSIDGRTGEMEPIRRALGAMVKWFGKERVSNFGPLKLKALRERWIAEGRVRPQINAAVRRVVRCFRWAVENELADGSVLHALRAVPGLRAGRSAARESTPILPVTDAMVEAAVPFMPTPIRAMVELQRRSGARPGEIVQATSAMVDRSDPAVWVFRPARHKSRHHGRDRAVYFGPVCQSILTPFMESRDPDAPLFSPMDAVARMRAERKAKRKTPLSCGNREGSNTRKQPKRAPREKYDAVSYGQAVARACDKAFPPPPPLGKVKDESDAEWKKRLGPEGLAELARWRKDHRFHPNQLRHSFATAVRREYGLEASQVLLGHAKADVTQVYAARDATKAVAVAAVIG